MPQISLFDFEEYLDSLAAIQVPEEPALEEVNRVVQALEPEVVIPPRPVFREREWILKQAEGIPGSVALVRINRKHMAVIPVDLDAALMLHAYRHSEADLVTEQKHTKTGDTRTVVIQDGSNPEYRQQDALPDLIRACIPIDSKKESDNRVYFYFANAFGPDIRETFLYRHLEMAGFHVIVPPSLDRWLKREWRRVDRDLTAYDLPEIKDNRPLFDQMEEGLLLVCKHATGDFELDARYLVVSLSDEHGSELGVRLQKMVGDDEDARLEGDKLTWQNNRPMEDYFQLEAGTETVYDPAASLVAKYREQHQQMVRRLESMNLDIYRHSVYDAAQMALKRNGLNCKPQRMGKTAESISTSLLWGSKRIGIVSPTKDTRMEVKTELDRLGLTDYVFVDELEDLKKPARFYLMHAGFVKGLLKDPAPRTDDKFEIEAKCPYCDQYLMRTEYEPITSDFGHWRREVKYGYRCFNENCSYQWNAPKVVRVSPGRYRGSKRGAAWWNPDLKNRFIGSQVQKHVSVNGQIVPDGENKRSGSGYVDYERAKVAALYTQLLAKSRSGEVKDDHPKLKFKGRMNLASGYVKEAWSPARYKRFRKFFNTLIVDEIHILATGKSDQARAILSLRAKHHIGLTGTPMPNSPADPYWQCHWVFGGGTPTFPYFRNGKDGFTKYWKTFCKNVEITNSEGQTRKKRLPIAVAPLKQRKLHAPLIIRRSFTDPAVVQSLLEKGFHYPTIRYHTLQCDPDPYQADLLVHAMDRFQEAYEQYRQQMESEERDLNTAYVLSSMSLLKVAATCPDFLNLKLERAGCPGKIYQGVPGGGKTKEIRRIVYNKISRAEKVLVVSFYKHELNILMDNLAEFGPVLYDVDNWDAEQRFECRQQFLHDPSCRLLLGSINALQVGVDLSSADTVICSDLLWSPGRQDQAVARILKPTRQERECEVYYTILKHSLDEQIYHTFYSKRVASEQVMDGVITTPRPTEFNIRAFVDQVLAEREGMAKYTLDIQMEAVNYVPMLNALASSLDDRE